MDALVIVPVAALFGLSLVAPGAKRPSLKPALAVWILALLAFFAVRPMIPDRVAFAKSDSSIRVQSQLLHLRNHVNWQAGPVLILEGSSATQFGVDGVMIEHALRRSGIDATVLQFCLEGANHFERLHMLESFYSDLTPAERGQLKNTKVVLLSEVFDAYDENPLYLFLREAYSERAIAYLNPRNAVDAWRAYSLYPGGRKERYTVLWDLGEHALLNEFCAGAFSDMQWPELEQTEIPPFFGLSGVKPGFKFDGAWNKFSADSGGPVDFPPLPWPQWESYYRTLHERCGPLTGSVGFFALPVLEPQRYLYQKAFAALLPPETVIIGPADRSLWSDLDSEDDWFDGAHPQKQGAQIFTSWLSTEIISKWSRLTKNP